MYQPLHKPYPIRRQYEALHNTDWICDYHYCKKIVKFDDMMRHLHNDHGMLVFTHTRASQYFTKVS